MLIHEMLEETAKRYPQNIAVKHEDETITFEELNEQSTKLATFFCSKGVKEGDRIAIVAEKSIQSVVSIFGILKAGAMYVPIDSSIPKGRLEYILKDCGVDIVITSQDIFEVNKKLFIEKEMVVFIDSVGIHPSETSLDIKISKDASAYIIYTSGSTGEPKGVEIYHHSVTNLMQWYCHEFNIREEDKILSFVPFWFDASICDLFSFAKSGATLVILPEGINMFPGEFAQFLVDEQISLFFAPSSQFVLTLDALKELKYPHLKTVMFGAEELPVKYVRELKDVFKGCELVNIYGPTECTDVAMFYRVGNIPDDMEKIPIGKPYHGVGAFIYEGELIISGSNLMKGYWNKAKETNNVISKYLYPIYYTGDLVKRDNNENFVYVGRKDRQIKSMGRRIQLEEIEHILNEHPFIKEAVVTCNRDLYLLMRVNINCYVVTNLTKWEIIEYCRTKLSDYMVPTKVYICDTLPKTRTGKLNRKELK